nr:hypothetical protein [Tanacetum cinerariifolium]
MVGASFGDDKISNLDLHLQTSDFNSNTIIYVKLTGIENYRVWAAAMKLAINTRNKTSFLDGTCLKFTYANNLFLGQIFSDNASEVWAELKETYDKLDGSIIFNLLQKIHNFKQGELTVSEYYHKLNSLWREFYIMTKLPKCSCATREDVSKHTQLIKLMQFLMGLNDVFQPIRSSLLARETLPDMNDAFAIISREESHRGIASSSSGSVGHTVDRCFDIIGYPLGYTKNPGLKPNGPRTFNANYVSSPSEKGASLYFTNEQMMRLMNLINEAPSGSVQANMAALVHPNGTLAKIKYDGNLKLSDKIVLFDVLAVPKHCVTAPNLSGSGILNIRGCYFIDQ